MADYFRETFEALKQTAEGLVQANLEIKRAAEAAMAAKDEHEDLRETVQRLESLVTDLTKQVHELRSRIQ
jgi:uncharacterized protein YaaN involved in tellurite resistance